MRKIITTMMTSVLLFTMAACSGSPIPAAATQTGAAISPTAVATAAAKTTAAATAAASTKTNTSTTAATAAPAAANSATHEAATDTVWTVPA